MRKLLLLIASLSLFTVFGWARSDFYNEVVAFQAEQYQAEKASIGQPPIMLAGNNMITGGQVQGVRLFGMKELAPVRADFYNAVLAKQIDELKAENDSNGAAPTLLAGNNMITGGQASPGRRGEQDFYNQVLSAKAGEFQAENNSVGAGHILLANMITGEQVFVTPENAGPEDFYNQVLSAQVAEYNIDNNAIAPSATEFAESQSPSLVPGSMASNVGGRGESDWYSKTVATQAELNRRIKKSELPNTF